MCDESSLVLPFLSITISDHLYSIKQYDHKYSNGNSIVVIEHNLDVIKTADWIIDLGPEGGSGGGEILIASTPEQVADCQKSYTGKYLKPLLIK